MNDMYTALAAEHVDALLAEAGKARLARLARCCSATRDGLVERARNAGSATLRWLRHGQLGAYPSTCSC